MSTDWAKNTKKPTLALGGLGDFGDLGDLKIRVIRGLFPLWLNSYASNRQAV